MIFLIILEKLCYLFVTWLVAESWLLWDPDPDTPGNNQKHINKYQMQRNFKERPDRKQIFITVSQKKR